MSRILIALFVGSFAAVGIAQTPPQPAVPAPTTATKDAKAKQGMVESATADKGYTQRAADQAAKAEGTGAAARPDRQAASKANVQATTADKGYTQRAAEQAAKAEGTGASAKEARRAASRENVKSTTADKGYTQRAADEAAKAAAAKKQETTPK